MRTTLNITIRTTAALGVVATLSGCMALPPAVQVASIAMDGYSYATTGKTVTDHALSAVANRDCAMMRILQGNDICSNNSLDDVNMDLALASGTDVGEPDQDKFNRLSEIWLTTGFDEVEKNPHSEKVASNASSDAQLTASLLNVGFDEVEKNPHSEKVASNASSDAQLTASLLTVGFDGVKLNTRPD